MKTIFTLQITKVITVLLITVFLFNMNVCRSQNYFIKAVDSIYPTNSINSELFQHFTFPNKKNIALRFNGYTWAPTAKFQIKDSISPRYQNRPLFEVDAAGVGSIKLWNNDGINTYGIYQKHQEIYTGGLLNLFQDPATPTN